MWTPGVEAGAYQHIMRVGDIVKSQTTFMSEPRVTIIIRSQVAVKMRLVSILVLGYFAHGLQLTTALPHPKKGLFRTELV